MTGHVGEAAELVAQMQADIDEIIAGMPPLEEPLSVYHELDNTFFSVTSDTFIGQVYNRLGLRNIADEAEGTGGAYPQLNAEFIISTNPDLIFLADTKCCGESAETVAARPGWAIDRGGRQRRRRRDGRRHRVPLGSAARRLHAGGRRRRPAGGRRLVNTPAVAVAARGRSRRARGATGGSRRRWRSCSARSCSGR